MFTTTSDARPLTPVELALTIDLIGAARGVEPTDMGITEHGELVAVLPDDAPFSQLEGCFLVDGNPVVTIGLELYYLGETLPATPVAA